MEADETDLLIVGAGPFGLAASAYARHAGVEHRVVGEPMGFWNSHMPAGMLLRSACDWHFDVTDEHTIEAYADELGFAPADVEPLSVDFYLGYCAWFIRQKKIVTSPGLVTALSRSGTVEHAFEAALDSGGKLRARNVLLAVGMAHFANIPRDLAAMLPAGHFGHTCDTVHLSRFEGERVVIVGGRQSAFEWAALLGEAGAREVHLTYRHDTPTFVASDWTWVPALVERICATPEWYRDLASEERSDIAARLWGEGRLKLEPWLAPRLERPNIHLWPRTTIAACETAAGGSMQLRLDTGERIDADHVIFATGYKVNMGRVPLLADGDLLRQIEIVDGYPVLDAHFQTSVQGLYVTSMAAGGAFGPFFGFTVSVRAAARAVVDHLVASNRTD